MGDVAVIGGTGFLGRYVCAAIQEAGRSVRLLSRRRGCDARTINADAFRGCDAVVNLAGIKREQGDQTFRAVHVDLVARLIDAMKGAGIRRLVHISVVVARPDPALPYHDTKHQGEELVRGSGLDWTVLRPGVIYGVGDDLLSHLALMLRTAPIFPIVNDGRAPMMPVQAADVARAVGAALERPASVGQTLDVVGPERMELRDVVRRTAVALGLPVWILPTPVGLMKIPVSVMEATMNQPLSTRAQLAMLVEGLAGDPEPAKRILGIEAAPFTPERLRPLLAASGLLPTREIRTAVGLGLYGLSLLLLAAAFLGPVAPWKGMTVAMGPLFAAALSLKAVRHRIVPTFRRVLLGLASGAVLYGLTEGLVPLLRVFWPGWEVHAHSVGAWKQGYSTPFLWATLVMIVVAEEAFWRGVITRFSTERLGTLLGVVTAALLYTAAHVATLNPVLLLAALGCGLYWGLLAAATDDLTAPIVSHLAWDVMVMFVTPLI